MKTRVAERRRHSRLGLFGQIEDATYRVLRRTQSDAGEAGSGQPAEVAEDGAIPAVNVIFGLPEWEQLGEPF